MVVVSNAGVTEDMPNLEEIAGAASRRAPALASQRHEHVVQRDRRAPRLLKRPGVDGLWALVAERDGGGARLGLGRVQRHHDARGRGGGGHCGRERRCVRRALGELGCRSLRA